MWWLWTPTRSNRTGAISATSASPNSTGSDGSTRAGPRSTGSDGSTRAGPRSTGSGCATRASLHSASSDGATQAARHAAARLAALGPVSRASRAATRLQTGLVGARQAQHAGRVVWREVLRALVREVPVGVLLGLAAAGFLGRRTGRRLS